jgi:hypothetical protein
VESVSFSGRAECDLTTNGSNLSERSAGLEKEDSNLTEIEVDEVLGLVGHI